MSPSLALEQAVSPRSQFPVLENGVEKPRSGVGVAHTYIGLVSSATF